MVDTPTTGERVGIRRFCSSAVVHEEPITPPVEVKYNQLLISGQFDDAASGKTFPTFDPRTGEAITTVAEANTEDVNRAVSAARKAFDEGPWPKMTVYERSCIMLRFADLLEKHSDELAALETLDNGKPYEQVGLIKFMVLHLLLTVCTMFRPCMSQLVLQDR